MYERTIPLYTFSKSYAMTGLRLGYVAITRRDDPRPREEVLFYTASNVASVVQFGGIGALEGPQDCIEAFRDGAARAARSVLRGHRANSPAACSRAQPPAGAFYAFLRIDPAWQPTAGATTASLSWRWSSI